MFIKLCNCNFVGCRRSNRSVFIGDSPKCLFEIKFLKCRTQSGNCTLHPEGRYLLRENREFPKARYYGNSEGWSSGSSAKQNGALHSPLPRAIDSRMIFPEVILSLWGKFRYEDFIDTIGTNVNILYIWD